MSNGFQELQDSDVMQAVEEWLLPQLQDRLTVRAPGHCMRLADLDLDLMINLCRAIRKETPHAQVFILGDLGYKGEEKNLFISSTKLVELRNPMPDGTLRPPLLIFLPASLRASAEDSFSVATFEEIKIGNIYEDLVNNLLQRIPLSLQGYVSHILYQLLAEENWPWIDPVAQFRFLLLALKNEVDGEALGAALYELGLVPDIHLFRVPEPEVVFARLRKNMRAMRTLTYSDQSVRGRVLDLRLSDKAVQRQLTTFLVEAGVDNPRMWTRRIIIDRNNWGITFDKWAFEEAREADEIVIKVERTDLPTVTEDESHEHLQGLIGSQVLVPHDHHKFTVSFTVEPHPLHIQKFHHISIQIISKESGPVGKAKIIEGWQNKRNSATVSLDKLDKTDFEEGWHVVRVLAWTKEGNPLPLREPEGFAPGSQLRPNESEDFYVLPSGPLDDLPQPRAIPQEISLEHALLKLQFTAALARRDPASIQPQMVKWVSKSSKSRKATPETLEVKFGRDGTFHIPVAGPLRVLEQQMLQSPEYLLNWHLRIDTRQEGTTLEDISHSGEEARISTKQNYSLQRQRAAWPRTLAAESFLAARAHYFSLLHSGSENLISQAANFLALKDASIQYAEAYQDLLLDLRRKVEQSKGTDQQQAILWLRTALSIDTIRIEITNSRAKMREAALLGPTHPLRALWLTTWAHVAQQWLLAATEGPEEYIGPVRDALLQELVPLHIPAILPTSDGRVFTAVDNVHPFWSLYVSPGEEDTRGMLGEICTAMGLPEPDSVGAAITGEVLASRIERYLVQHPYVRILIINAFNPGRATVLAEALLVLQKHEAFSHLGYDIRLFVPDPEAPSTGEAIQQLLSPDRTTGEEAADAFSKATRSHLFPKLSLAIHSTQDFYTSPDCYRAHLSILIDVFPAQDVGTEPPFLAEDRTSLHGLIQDFEIDFQDDDSGTFWRRQPRHGEAHPLTGVDTFVELLAHLPQVLSGATATVAMSSPAFDRLPTVTLGLEREQRELIHQVHDVSDWVYTIDRNIGVEFFDHGGRRKRPSYLIDYLPNTATISGHQLVITSRSLAELESLLRPVLQKYGLKAEGKHAALILDHLRSLSGRLALKLISSPTQQAEVLGLALARLFLERQEALSNQIVLPLDTHLNLFQSIKKQDEELGNAVSLQRTDLALFHLDVSSRIIRCNLVEVKCYTQVGSLGAYQQLKEKIAQQINHSQEVLRRHFDPHWRSPDRPDRLLKTRELATLLEFYLGRSVRYGLIHKEAAADVRMLLRSLEDGYQIEFTRSALIFDFKQSGTEAPDQENGIEYHRIGLDIIQALVAEAATSLETPQAEDEGHLRTTSVPLLDSAAFMVPTNSKETTLRPHADESAFEQPGIKGFDQEDGVQGKPIKNERQLDEIPLQIPDTTPEVTSAYGPVYEVMLGAEGYTPQYGILGETSGRKVALDLNQTHTISLFGAQGSGKSYTLGSIVEMACLPIPNINLLPSPLATVIFHYSQIQDYKPEFTSMTFPNGESHQLALLRERYGAEPCALRDILLFAPPRKLAERQDEFPGVEVLPITFAASELKVMHWRFLMGAVGSQSLYLRQINLIMRNLRDNLTLKGLLQGVEHSILSDHLKDLARTRLQFAAEYIDDSRRLTDVIRPGRLIIVDLRDEFIDKDEALGIFAVLLQIFSDATYQGVPFNKLVVFDEAHKYIESPDLIAGLTEVVREMRHKGTSILVASQDPSPGLTPLIELSSQIILHKFNSPSWLKNIQRANASLNALTPEKLSQLNPGEAYIWSTKATDDGFVKGAMKIRCRPRVTQHGGNTKTAI